MYIMIIKKDGLLLPSDSTGNLYFGDQQHSKAIEIVLASAISIALECY